MKRGSYFGLKSGPKKSSFRAELKARAAKARARARESPRERDARRESALRSARKTSPQTSSSSSPPKTRALRDQGGATAAALRAEVEELRQLLARRVVAAVRVSSSTLDTRELSYLFGVYVLDESYSPVRDASVFTHKRARALHLFLGRDNRWCLGRTAQMLGFEHDATSPIRSTTNSQLVAAASRSTPLGLRWSTTRSGMQQQPQQHHLSDAIDVSEVSATELDEERANIAAEMNRAVAITAVTVSGAAGRGESYACVMGSYVLDAEHTPTHSAVAYVAVHDPSLFLYRLSDGRWGVGGEDELCGFLGATAEEGGVRGGGGVDSAELWLRSDDSGHSPVGLRWACRRVGQRSSALLKEDARFFYEVDRRLRVDVSSE